jgi:PKHD-type hydroxylase
VVALAIPPPEKPAFVTHCQWSGGNALLSQPECEWVIQRGQSQPLAFASVGTPTDQRVALETRCVESSVIDSQDAAWLYERIAQRIATANAAYFEFDLTGLIEPVQFLKYTTGKGERPDGHYSWHVDFGEGSMSTRKLSMVIQLSPGDAYDGADFTIASAFGHQRLNYREQGAAFAFPSWSPHMVGPLTRGVRYALVAWVHGPRFR